MSANESERSEIVRRLSNGMVTSSAAGTTVMTVLGAANHDPAMFADPDDLRLDRPNAGRHLAFAAGIHYCLGAPLARLEGEVVFERLLARFSTIDADTTPVWRPSLTLRGLDTLQVSVR